MPGATDLGLLVAVAVTSTTISPRAWPHCYNIVTTSEVNMQIAIRRIGNSKGVVIPKSMLAMTGLQDVEFAAVAVENGSIVLRKPEKPVREGWAEAAATIAAKGGDELLMGEFGNADDQESNW